MSSKFNRNSREDQQRIENILSDIVPQELIMIVFEEPAGDIPKTTLKTNNLCHVALGKHGFKCAEKQT